MNNSNNNKNFLLMVLAILAGVLIIPRLLKLLTVFSFVIMGFIGVGILGLSAAVIISVLNRNSNTEKKQPVDTSVKGEYTSKPQPADEEKEKERLGADNYEILQNARMSISKSKELAKSLGNKVISVRAEEVLFKALGIVEVLNEKPEKIPKVRQFLSYYLPTLSEILESYSKIEKSGVKADETGVKVINYLDDIRTAMDRQHSNLFEQEILNLSVEMEAMTLACARDGLLTREELLDNIEVEKKKEAELYL